MCRSFGPDLVYVNEMVMTNAVVHRNAKTMRMMQFGPEESPRSLQLYGSDPAMIDRAVRQICDEGLVDHLDLNFGCPAAKVTRKGGGAAVPAKPALLRAIVRAAVTAFHSKTGLTIAVLNRFSTVDDDTPQWSTRIRTLHEPVGSTDIGAMRLVLSSLQSAERDYLGNGKKFSKLYTEYVGSRW